MSLSFHIFANAALGKGLSGGDRIFIEFAKRLSKKNKVNIHVWEEGYSMCLSQDLKRSENINFRIINVGFWCKVNFLLCYLARIVLSIKDACFLKIDDESTIVYSASEFWMDSLPALVLKLRYPKVKWIATWFQTAPSPLIGFSSGDRETRYRLSALYYWLMQLPIKPLIKSFADLVLINNESEKKQFSSLNIKGRVTVILGAVNTEKIEKWMSLNSKKLSKVYDGVFQGRFHPQKGVVELINIWALVVKKKPDAKLAMIGDGPLMDEVKARIKQLGLEENIKLFGFVFDGPKKYEIFSQSKIVIHPAFYDSGGMAAAEAMAFGLPAVGFNLESYKSYYPEGMVKVRVGDLDQFANTIISLFEDEKKRKEIGEQAKEMILKDWSWDKKVSKLMMVLEKI